MTRRVPSAGTRASPLSSVSAAKVQAHWGCMSRQSSGVSTTLVGGEDLRIGGVNSLALAKPVRGIDNQEMGKRLGKAALAQWHGQRIVLPSLLQCDFTNLERDIRRLEGAGVAGLHLDVMDGHFVPNLTYGMPIVAAVRQLTDLPLDVHLMISQPHKYVQAFIDAGADVVTVHAEVAENLELTLESIRSGGCGVGLAFNPATDLKVAEALLPLCDLVLIMSVNAGFGGQAFNPVALDKLRVLRNRLSPDVLLEVDGGVNLSTIRDCAHAGATLFVVGSAIFGQADYAAAIAGLTQQIRI